MLFSYTQQFSLPTLCQKHSLLTSICIEVFCAVNEYVYIVVALYTIALLLVWNVIIIFYESIYQIICSKEHHWDNRRKGNEDINLWTLSLCAKQNYLQYDGIGATITVCMEGVKI